MEPSRHAFIWLSLAVTLSAKVSMPVLEGSGTLVSREGVALS